MKIMLLQSADGADYIIPLGVPDGLPEAEAIAKVETVMTKAKVDTGDEWNFADMESPLVNAGFTVFQYFNGPQWD